MPCYVPAGQQRGPGQTQHDTPPCDEHVPDRFCEQDHEPSRHWAVGRPHDALDGTAPPLQVGLVGEGAGVPVTLVATSFDAALWPQLLIAMIRT